MRLGRSVLWILAAALTMLACADSTTRAAMPERIRPLSQHMLTPERYRELEHEWRAYTRAQPGDAVGWVQLSKAANYAGAPCDSVIRFAERAYQIAPHDPEVLATLGGWRWIMFCESQPTDPRPAIALLEEALRLDPNQDRARVSLWVQYMAAGRPEDANAQMRALLDQGRMPEPLVDWGYNLLVGLPPDAILLTNGDNDTCPLIALQVARGFRADVAVVNLSMLNLGWYRRQLRERRPSVPVPQLDTDPRSRTGSAEAVRGLIAALAREGWKRPLYMACTVDHKVHAIPNRTSLEGVVLRILPAAGTDMDVDTARIARNMEQVYRLESATSPGLDWEWWSSLRMLMRNYGAADFQLASALARGGDLPRARAAMGRALTISEFHRTGYSGQLIETWSSWDRGSAELEAWRVRVGAASRGQ
jgi:hypothetical protein